MCHRRNISVDGKNGYDLFRPVRYEINHTAWISQPILNPYGIWAGVKQKLQTMGIQTGNFDINLRRRRNIWVGRMKIIPNCSVGATYG